MNRWTRHGILAVGLVGAFALGRASLSPAGQADSKQASSSVAKGGPAVASIQSALASDPGEAVARIQSASAEDCLALIGTGPLWDLPPLLRESVLLRLSEIDPEALARVLLDVPLSSFTFDRSGYEWLVWLARSRPDLLRARIEDLSTEAKQREFLEGMLRQAEFVKKTDPLEVLDTALKRGDLNGIPQALEELAKLDPKLAVSQLSKLLESGAWFRAYNPSLFTTLAAEDPEGMKAIFAMVKSPELQMPMATAIARSIAKDDPLQAVAFYNSMSTSRARSFVAIEIAAMWAKKDPEAALAWVESSLSDGPAKRSALACALAPLVDTDPARVLAAISLGERYSDTLTQMMTGQGSMGLNGPGVIPANTVRERAALALVAKDPLQAMAILSEQEAVPKDDRSGSRFNKASLLGLAAATWMKSDPGAAVAWLSGLEKTERGNVLNQTELGSAFNGLPFGEISKAASAVIGMEDKQSADRLLSVMAQAMTEADPAAALQFAKQLPDEVRNSSLQRIIGEIAKADPEMAMQEVAGLPPKLRARTHGTIAQAMTANNPAEAVRYLDSVPAEERDDYGYQSCLASWVSQNREQAREWWSNLPEDDNVRRKAALNAMAGEIYGADPSSRPWIMKEVGGLSNVNERSRVFSSLIFGIAQQDPEAAQALIDNPGMEISDSAIRNANQQVEFMRGAHSR